MDHEMFFDHGISTVFDTLFYCRGKCIKNMNKESGHFLNQMKFQLTVLAH
jgi:hypothetical protein